MGGKAKAVEQHLSEIAAGNINMVVPHYLVLSFLYYERDISIVSDEWFDHLCKVFLARWDDIQHFHKHLVEREGLEAGTGYHLKYPPRVQGAAFELASRFGFLKSEVSGGDKKAASRKRRR